MKFCSVVNCMDGRVQLPVIKYVQRRFCAEYVDSITEAGPILILSEDKNSIAKQSIFDRLKISVEKHQSAGIAVVGHYDCAGNPAAKEIQMVQIQQAIENLRQQYEHIDIVGLWVDKNWEVHEVG